MAAAAFQNCKCEGTCDINLHTKHHNCPHKVSGKVIGGGNVYINGSFAQKVGDDAVYESCQHGGAGKIVGGSGSVYIGGQPAARQNDAVRCQNPMCEKNQAITDGSSNVFIGD